jgi:hypothetical protein
MVPITCNDETLKVFHRVWNENTIPGCGDYIDGLIAVAFSQKHRDNILKQRLFVSQLQQPEPQINTQAAVLRRVPRKLCTVTPKVLRCLLVLRRRKMTLTLAEQPCDRGPCQEP